ncbi:protein of unknown function [Andreprevotia lacus DSM 23236]|uniref:DUF4124 domain-containing protein n=1 Tax=Andreprevotia lacus DSM 23236 TaxID=1121001 RepID=A0A1W1XE00_9NEIS|nr:DUF4124 domain-containing protein [Andreprevotia lacus]SMC22123.1 protein of unknown function [Andreprevotia lacus DSM 23236]
MKPILAVLLLCLAGLASAEVYKWKDADGNWHYSDQPPPGADKNKAKVLDIKDQPVNSVPAKAKVASGAAEGLEKGGKKASAVAASDSKPVKKYDEAACNAAQTRLHFLQGANKMRNQNEKGMTEFLPAAKKAEEISKAQQQIEESCGGGGN